MALAPPSAVLRLASPCPLAPSLRVPTVSSVTYAYLAGWSALLLRTGSSNGFTGTQWYVLWSYSFITLSSPLFFCPSSSSTCVSLFVPLVVFSLFARFAQSNTQIASMSSFLFDGLYRVLALLDLSMTYKNDVYLFPVKRSSPLAEMEMLRSHVFVGNTGHFHNEIDFAGSEGLKCLLFCCSRS